MRIGFEPAELAIRFHQFHTTSLDFGIRALRIVLTLSTTAVPLGAASRSSQMEVAFYPEAAMKRIRCEYCGKLTHSSQLAARSYLAYILRLNLEFRKQGVYATKPYPCPHGNGWHLGRDPGTLMIDFRKGRTVNIGTTASPSSPAHSSVSPVHRH